MVQQLNNLDLSAYQQISDHRSNKDLLYYVEENGLGTLREGCEDAISAFLRFYSSITDSFNLFFLITGIIAIVLIVLLQIFVIVRVFSINTTNVRVLSLFAYIPPADISDLFQKCKLFLEAHNFSYHLQDQELSYSKGKNKIIRIKLNKSVEEDINQNNRIQSEQYELNEEEEGAENLEEVSRDREGIRTEMSKLNISLRVSNKLDFAQKNFNKNMGLEQPKIDLNRSSLKSDRNRSLLKSDRNRSSIKIDENKSSLKVDENRSSLPLITQNNITEDKPLITKEVQFIESRPPKENKDEVEEEEEDLEYLHEKSEKLKRSKGFKRRGTIIGIFGFCCIFIAWFATRIWQDLRDTDVFHKTLEFMDLISERSANLRYVEVFGLEELAQNDLAAVYPDSKKI